MTLDEAIKKLLDEAEQQDKWADNYVRMDYYSTPPWERRQRARGCRQLTEWLQELIAYRKLRICCNCRHYVGGTTHFGECHVTSDIEPCVVCVNQTACDTFFDYKDFRSGVGEATALKPIGDESNGI